MRFFFLVLPLSLVALFSDTRTHLLSVEETHQSEWVWEQGDVTPFKELVLSWNASRPLEGRYSFFISVRQGLHWSPWLFYGEWGNLGQIMFNDAPQSSFAFAHEGKVKSRTGLSDGYRIKVCTSGGADLHHFYNVSVCTADLDKFTLEEGGEFGSVFLANVPRHSQITTRNPRYTDLALPTATTVLTNYCLGNRSVDPAEFAERVIDDDTAFYENTSFSIAQASHHLGGQRVLQLSYLSDFSVLHQRLMEGFPSVVFISGWVPGCPRPYRMAHAVCVIGYDAVEKKVHCIDSAFPNEKATLTSYLLSDFLKGWSRQCNQAITLSTREECSKNTID